MAGFITFLHVVVCVLIVVIILMQSGRGGGLTESFSSAESIFGVQTNSLLIKATTVFASLFLITCVSLAIINSKKAMSLMSNVDIVETKTIPVEADAVPIGVTAPAEEQKN